MVDVIDKIYNVLYEVDRCKGSYFWRPASSASTRRHNERKHNIEPFEWSESGDTYTARFVYEESCNNVYAYGVYTRNGKKTTLTAIKNSLKRMEQRQRKERVI